MREIHGASFLLASKLSNDLYIRIKLSCATSSASARFNSIRSAIRYTSGVNRCTNSSQASRFCCRHCLISAWSSSFVTSTQECPRCCYSSAIGDCFAITGLNYTQSVWVLGIHNTPNRLIALLASDFVAYSFIECDMGALRLARNKN